MYLIGLVLLRTKLASWRYQKTNRTISIMPNIKMENTAENVTDFKKAISNDNEDQEVPPVIEDIIEQLIQGLRDKAITIRYICHFIQFDITFINFLIRFYNFIL